MLEGWRGGIRGGAGGSVGTGCVIGQAGLEPRPSKVLNDCCMDGPPNASISAKTVLTRLWSRGRAYESLVAATLAANGSLTPTMARQVVPQRDAADGSTCREAQVLAEAWRIEYNTYRPHSSLGGLTPAEYAERWTINQPALS
jgi:transposase InsO family protein